MKEGEFGHAPGPVGNRWSQDKEQAANALSRRLSLRPSAIDLKFRNILKVESMDNVNNPGLQKNVDFQSAAKVVKSCLKKRPEKVELEEMNIVKVGELSIDPSLAAKQALLRQNQLKDALDNKLRERPDMEELADRKILVFQETVEVYPTFKKNEYNRKPDEDATFRKLTPQMKVQIREELNTFKRNEMTVHESITHTSHVVPLYLDGVYFYIITRKMATIHFDRLNLKRSSQFDERQGEDKENRRLKERKLRIDSLDTHDTTIIINTDVTTTPLSAAKIDSDIKKNEGETRKRKQQKQKLYCLCRKDWSSDKSFMIKCDKCKEWYHGHCLPKVIKEEDACHYIKFHCFKCEPEHGPSIYQSKPRKSSRGRDLISYSEKEGYGIIHELKYTKIIQSRQFETSNFPRMNGSDLTLEYVEKTGLNEPVIVENPEGLDMIMPDKSLTVRNVAEVCGLQRKVQVLEVSTQSERVMTLKEWADYFEQPSDQRRQILNVISLEISGSKLGKSIKRPKIVRDLDWVDVCWPESLKKSEKEYPQVQLYCLMSVENSFTDFHVDFGGTSVFYHLLSGEKRFYFIKPSPKNLKKYTKWTNSADQSTTFLSDEIHDPVYQVTLLAGQTMIIPSGWIHAVFTPTDSIVIGGNFLHGFHIKKQLEIFDIENKTNVPSKFRFPFYEKIHWYACLHYFDQLQANPSQLSKKIIDGLPSLIAFLRAPPSSSPSLNSAEEICKSEDKPGNRLKRRKLGQVPKDLKSPDDLLNSFVHLLGSLQYLNQAQ